MEFLQDLLNTEGFPPRWLCGTSWQPFTGWFMIASDLMIFGAYLSIPLILLYFVNKKKDMVFPRIFWLFAAFIFACGVSHLLDALMFWWPVYRLNTLERFITGLISWVTVFALIPIVPVALALRSPKALEKEVEERRRAEAELTRLNEDLEQIISARTHDLNEKAWQLEIANKELESFSYSVSHDLKAPLRKIAQLSELIQSQHSEKLDPNLQMYLERIAANAFDMNSLIEALLSFSRIANAELQNERVPLSEMAQSIAQDLEEQEPERKVEFVIQEQIIAKGDPALLKSVLQNLFSNAWKYTSQNEETRIEFGSMEEQGRLCCFVRDNGVGFDMMSIDRLFKPFQRLHVRSDFPGSGIGLANVQRIISRHGGRVGAEGKPNEGATFYFSLPSLTFNGQSTPPDGLKASQKTEEIL
jgi:two-component system, chemotaxis family, sensor kinase Cph1